MESVLARVGQPRLLSLLGRDGRGPVPGLMVLLDEVEVCLAGLEEVCDRAARTHDVALLFDAAPRIRALMEDAKARISQVVDVDPVLIALALGGDVRKEWDRLDLAHKRRVVRAVIVPVVDRATSFAQRGVDPGRVTRSRWL